MANGQLLPPISTEIFAKSKDLANKLGFDVLKIPEVNKEIYANARYYVSHFRSAYEGNRRDLADFIALVPTQDLIRNLNPVSGQEVLADQLKIYFPIAEKENPVLAAEIWGAVDELAADKPSATHLKILEAARKQFGPAVPLPRGERGSLCLLTNKKYSAT